MFQSGGRVVIRWALAAAAATALLLSGCATAAAAHPKTARQRPVTAGQRPVIARQRPVIAAYYYHSSSMPVSAIPVSRLNDVIYAFASINSAGECSVPDAPTAADFAALGRLKRSHPRLRTEISVGGWGASGFSDAA